MWQCDNCGYTDEDGATFEEETEESLEDTVRYCPECGSDEVVLKNNEEETPALHEVVDHHHDRNREHDLHGWHEDAGTEYAHDDEA